MTYHIITFVSALPQAKFDLFLQEELTVKESKKFTEELNKRVQYIIQRIQKTNNRYVVWADYDNSCRDYNDGEIFLGYFDIEKYKKEVFYKGEFEVIYSKNNFNFKEFENKFPVEWIYTNFEQYLENEYQQQQEKIKILGQKELEEEKKQKIVSERYENLTQIISLKLTKEEFACIAFVGNEQFVKNLNKIKKNEK